MPPDPGISRFLPNQLFPTTPGLRRGWRDLLVRLCRCSLQRCAGGKFRILRHREWRGGSSLFAGSHYLAHFTWYFRALWVSLTQSGLHFFWFSDFLLLLLVLYRPEFQMRP
ncbi:unnamed protein product [Cuscuta europaea]|uniref:Uncharacterized protein n=1 Tax=Cuscuta europaea TaxID=41803 RepID=A0A9P1EIS1_CUSEU|nr:unnamed protein product [Cuscuta europaea]